MVTIKPAITGLCDALRALAASQHRPVPGQQAAAIHYFTSSSVPTRRGPRAA